MGHYNPIGFVRSLTIWIRRVTISHLWVLPAPFSWRPFYPVRTPFSLWNVVLKYHTVLIKYLKATPVQLPCTPDEPLQGAIGLSPSRGPSSLPGSAQTNAPERRLPASRSPAFDLALARTSEALDTAAFLCMAVASTGTLFTLASAICSFTAGFSPAAQALALEIYTNRRSQNRGGIGKLFGALSVLQALGCVFPFPCWLQAGP